jgi:hypothetical protein
MAFEFLPPAQAELVEAVDHYNRERDGLGDEFAAEAYRTIRLIERHPLAWSKVSKRTRLCRTNRFMASSTRRGPGAF